MTVKIDREAEKLGQRLQKYRELANVTQSEMGEQVEVIHKKAYAVDFKMACCLVRQYFHRRNTKPFDNIFIEMGKYINPIRLGRADKRKVKPKSPVWFVYRVA